MQPRFFFCLLSSFTISFLNIVPSWKLVFCRVSKPGSQGTILEHNFQKNPHPTSHNPSHRLHFTQREIRLFSPLLGGASKAFEYRSNRSVGHSEPREHKGQWMLTGRVQAGSATSLVLDGECQSAAPIHLALVSRPKELWKRQAWV